MWKRPEGIPYPQVWHRFKGRRPMPDGTVPTFRVQDLTPDLFERAIDFMIDDFVVKEPMAKAIGLKDDPEAMKDLRAMWMENMNNRMGLICFRENAENPDEFYPEIIGMNVTTVNCKDEPKPETNNNRFKVVLDIMFHFSKLVDVFETYGVNEYLGAMGLSVSPKYRGQNIGAEILKARKPLCKAVGVKLTSTVFTAIESQILAKKVGFEEIASATYGDLAQLYCEDLLTAGVDKMSVMIMQFE